MSRVYNPLVFAKMQARFLHVIIGGKISSVNAELIQLPAVRVILNYVRTSSYLNLFCQFRAKSQKNVRILASSK